MYSHWFRSFNRSLEALFNAKLNLSLFVFCLICAPYYFPSGIKKAVKITCLKDRIWSKEPHPNHHSNAVWAYLIIFVVWVTITWFTLANLHVCVQLCKQYIVCFKCEDFSLPLPPSFQPTLLSTKDRKNIWIFPQYFLTVETFVCVFFPLLLIFLFFSSLFFLLFFLRLQSHPQSRGPIRSFHAFWFALDV